MSDTQDQAPANFETALEQLETNVERLENGDLPLEEALQAFEAGIAASRTCAQWLEQTRQRVQVLIRNTEDEMHLDFLDSNNSEDIS